MSRAFCGDRSVDRCVGGKRQRRVDLAETERELAGWDYEAKRLAVATTLADRFNAVLGAQRRVAALGEYADYCVTIDKAVSTLSNTDENGVCVLAPGTGLDIGIDDSGDTLSFSFYWRERVAEPSELNF